jgi:peptidoglycan/xylan/chitin deacetylase (PgdA/CDA1 family)
MVYKKENNRIPSLYLIWDFDAAIGQINSSYPYGYFEESIHEEIENVKIILQLASTNKIPMIFAITGFAAEKGTFPFHIPDLIRSIHRNGHEIASHSWKHEWFPFLELEQIVRTLEKSKMILEDCIGEKNGVKGFVPPFSRPMSWLKKGAISLSDRAIGPTFKGNDIQKIIPIVKNIGYDWMRVSYRTLFEKLNNLDRPKSLKREWLNEDGIICVPNNYVGFDNKAIDIINLGIKNQRDIIISGHPSGLSRNGSENIKNFKSFIDFVIKKRDEKKIEIKLLKDVK